MKKFIEKNCFWNDNKDKARVEKELEDLIAAETERCAKVVEKFKVESDFSHTYMQMLITFIDTWTNEIAKSIRDK